MFSRSLFMVDTSQLDAPFDQNLLVMFFLLQYRNQIYDVFSVSPINDFEKEPTHALLLPLITLNK